MNNFIVFIGVVTGLMVLISILVWLNTKMQHGSSTPPSLSQTSKEITDRKSFNNFIEHNKSSLGMWSRQNTIIKGIDLQEAKLTNADFQYCRLDNVNFRGAHLQNANFSETSLTSVDFQEADLSRCNFSDASIWSGTDFSNANLSNANLQHVHLYTDKLDGADFSDADVQNVAFAPFTCLSNVKFRGAKYNFFTRWSQHDPIAAGAISVDGLGPNPMYAERSKWYEYEAIRKDGLQDIKDKYSSLTDIIVKSRSEVEAKLNYAIENPDIDKAVANWKNPSLDNLYCRAAHEIRYVRNVYNSAHPNRLDIKLMLLDYVEIWLDVLEYHEYQACSNPDTGSKYLTDHIQLLPPKFESPIEEIYWEEWQRRGGQSILNLQYQYTDVNTGYRIDFVYLAAKVAIELDGYEYHNSRKQFTNDRQRQRMLELNGWRFIRFSGSEIIKDVESCFSETLHFIKVMNS